MFVSLASLLLAQLAAQPAVTGTFDGQCLYPEALRERAAAGELVTCNRAELARDAITFGQRGWQSRIIFSGSFDGNRMVVDRVTLANGRSHEVRGLCQLYFADERLSTIACTANSSRGSLAANFVVSRLNPSG